MIIRRSGLILLFLIIIFLPSCERESPSSSNRVVIGISADIESLNPLFAFNVVEGNITELMYLSLVQHKWDDKEGKILTEPMLAEKWEWSGDSSSIRLNLRDDVYWSDSVQFTAEDVVFSFDAYSDPDIESKLYGTFNAFYLSEDLSIDLEKTFEIISPLQIKINFLPGSTPDLFKIDFPLIPKHVYKNTDRKHFLAAPENLKPVTTGPYKFVRWDKTQSIILQANPASFLYRLSSVNEIIFKVIPDYNSRIIQLKNGEIDMIEDIKAEDAADLKKQEHLTVAPLKGREFEFAGWNNIDPAEYPSKEKIVPHPLFGNANIRKALTYAINRQEILEEFLYDNGEIAAGPVTPIFKNAINKQITPYPYDPDKAKEILTSEGWADNNNNGIIENGNKEFKFTLSIPGGNPRRNFAATIIKNNLKIVGIDVEVQTLELGVFIEDLIGKKLDAVIASWSVPVPIELKPYWYSDLQNTPLNIISYRNKKTDVILDKLDTKVSEDYRNELFKEFQQIIHEDQPVTFLYWIDNISAYNKRIKGVSVNPLGFIHHCWEWKTE